MANDKEERKKLVRHVTKTYIQSVRDLGAEEIKKLRENVDKACDRINVVIEEQIQSMKNRSDEACANIDAQE